MPVVQLQGSTPTLPLDMKSLAIPFGERFSFEYEIEAAAKCRNGAKGDPFWMAKAPREQQ
jgi:hypothetical protein